MTSHGVTTSKAILITCNTLFLMSGAALLVLSALLLLADIPRLLLSRLLLLGTAAERANYPPFYYAALILGCAGLVGCSTALLGCWSACQRSRALLGTFVAVLAVLLLGQASLVAFASAVPSGRDLLGVWGVLDPILLAEALQRNFGSPGHEQFTAAFDLAQTTFHCCGVLSPADFEASWWRMQELGGRELRVPLTCCRLGNQPGDDRAFLNPIPRNNSLCQAPGQTPQNSERYFDGCLPPLEEWFGTQWAYAAAIATGLVGLQLAVFASAISLCRRLPRRHT
ncbi:hypothetical protein B566_EDAN001247 [Ephemera danica]|nr:hypothetical protein B566_EDAN001247 [Ephemera danica]